MSSRRAVVAGTAAAVLAAVVATAPASPADGGSAVVSADLLRAAAAGPAPAVLTWDRHAVGRDQVAAYLAQTGMRTTVLEGLPVAFACAAGAADVHALAGAPGALSVWGEESLHAAPVEPPAGPGAGTAQATATATATATDLAADGAGVSIAVVDTGLDGRHPAVADRVLDNVRVLVSHREFLGPGDPPPCQDFFAAELEDSELTSGHGTALAGVAAGDGSASGGPTGLAPRAGLVGIGVSDSVTPDTDVRDSTRLSMFGALAGLNYALGKGLEAQDPVKVVLAGWVGSGLQDPYHPIALATRDLHDFGVTVVLPIGNKGPQGSDCSRADTCTVNPFAVGSYAVGVGAASKTDGTRLAEFSSRGDPEPRLAEGFHVAYEPLLSAPGEDVLAPRRIGTAGFGTPPGSMHGGGGSPTSDQTDLRYVPMSGTSVAAARVAGAVALMQQAARDETGCYLQSAQVRRLLAGTTSPMPAHPRWEAGAGLLDVDAAVDAARRALPVRKLDSWMCPGSSVGTTS